MKTKFGKKLVKEVTKEMMHILKRRKELAEMFARLETHDYDNPYFRNLVKDFSELREQYQAKQRIIDTMVDIESELKEG